MRPRLNLKALDALPEGPDKEEAKRLIAELDAVAEANPLAFFEPHPPQRPFFEARTPVVAAFAGNRFGKSTALITRILIECLDESWLPEHLRPYKRWSTTGTAPRGTFVRIVNPSFKLLESVILPALRQWAPAGALRGGAFDKAFKGAPDRKLTFANGSWIEFLTHEQELDKFGGAAMHVIGYDEPPPLDIREECMARLADYDGYELFACTPLKVNTAWMRSRIWRRREHPDITVVRGSIHDNPHLNQKAKERILAEFSNDLWRQAREFGDFVQVGGLVYPDAERCVVDPPSSREIRSWDTVVGIDPGIRNAGFVFAGFDDDNVCTFWADAMLQDATPDTYASHIRVTLAEKGLDVDDVTFIIDPAARQRSQINAETVQSALSREGINCLEGQNDVEAGIMQVRSRMAHGRLRISRECRHLRDTADTYAAEDRPDGKFVPVKDGTEHGWDAGRYLCASRPYFPFIEDEAPDRKLGWEPNRAQDLSRLDRPVVAGPLGAMS